MVNLSAYGRLLSFVRVVKPDWFRPKFLSRIRQRLDVMATSESISLNGSTFIFHPEKVGLPGQPILFPNVPSIRDHIYPIPRELPGYFQGASIKEGDVVYDGGAYPGDFTVQASRLVGPKGKVYAFEPNPTNRDLLTKVVSLNDCPNVVILPYALYSSECLVELEREGVGSRIASLMSRDAITAHAVTASLDYLIRSFPPPKFVKLDIEGAEIEALAGATELIDKNQPAWAIASYHKMSDGRQTWNLLEPALKRTYSNVRTGHRQHLTTYAF